jgi:hypothetical protein
MISLRLGRSLSSRCNNIPATAAAVPRTSLTALKAIYTLPEEHVSEFLDSYKLFSQEHVTGKNREAENTVNYYKVWIFGGFQVCCGKPCH